MKVLILGATGRTGRHLVNEALRFGFEVNVLVRDKSKLPAYPEQVTAFEGTPVVINDLANAMQGCDAVLSSLNISRTSDFPWAKLRTPKDFLSASMKNIIATAATVGIKRIIITTAWGVSETKKDIPYWFRWLIDHSNISYPYRNHEVQEELLKHSNMDWTAVRPAGLTNSTKIKEVLVSFNNSPKPGLTISRLNVARFMVDCLKDDLYVKESPVIS